MKFGKSLRQERESRGISLQAISDATKVSVRHLEALERDDEVDLPGGVFRRGILQAYCRHVGLNEADWLARFPGTDDNQDWTEFAEAVKRNRAPAPGDAQRRWWGVVALLAVVVVLGWAAWHFVLKGRLGYPSH